MNWCSLYAKQGLFSESSDLMVFPASRIALILDSALFFSSENWLASSAATPFLPRMGFGTALSSCPCWLISTPKVLSAHWARGSFLNSSRRAGTDSSLSLFSSFSLKSSESMSHGAVTLVRDSPIIFSGITLEPNSLDATSATWALLSSLVPSPAIVADVPTQTRSRALK